MELLIIIALLLLILGTTLIQLWAILDIEKYLSNFIPSEPKQEDAKVTDPFTKPREIYSSTTHIVVPKTPTEIRNQNFEKIKEGMQYGDIKKEE